MVIPVYRDWDLLTSCLDGLENQTALKSSYEIIIVNNDPFSPPPEKLSIPSNAVIINERRPGSYSARNKGLSIAKGIYIAFTDSDCIPDERWIEEGLKALVDGNDRVAGNVKLFFKSSKLSWAEVFEKSFSFRQKENVQKGVSVTANLFVRSDLFLEVGLFESSLLSGGDFEWNQRATVAGKSIAYSEKAIVFHPARASLKELLIKRKRVTLARPGGWKDVFKFFIPPLNELKLLKGREDLNLCEKSKAYFIAYILKVYRAILIFKSLMKFN